jgi:hypothetical protein
MSFPLTCAKVKKWMSAHLVTLLGPKAGNICRQKTGKHETQDGFPHIRPANLPADLKREVAAIRTTSRSELRL